MKYTIINPSTNLYDRIILAIKQEQETQKIKKLFLLLLIVFVLSFVITIASIILFIKEFNASGTIYVIKTALSDLSLFKTLWQYFFLAFIELLPITNIILFLTCLFITIFALRLLMYKKYLLIKILLNYSHGTR